MAVPVVWVVTTGGRIVLGQVLKRHGKKRAKKWVKKQATKGRRALPFGPVSIPNPEMIRKRSRGASSTQNNNSGGRTKTRKTMRGPSASSKYGTTKRSRGSSPGRMKGRRNKSRRAPYCWRHKSYHWCGYTR